MTLEEIKYFTDQFNNLRTELKQDLKDLRNHIDKTVGSQLDDHEARIVRVENFHWRIVAICSAIVFITQILINVAIGIFGK